LTTLTDDTGRIYYTKDSVITLINRLKRFYNYLYREKLILSNAFGQIKKIRSPRKLPKNIVTEEELSKILKYLSEFWKHKNIKDRRRFYKTHVIAELMYSTGLRMNEVRRLKVDDVDIERSVVKITDTKTKRERNAILNEYTCKVLSIYIRKIRDNIFFGNTPYKDLLFFSNVNLYMLVNKTLADACKALGIKIITSHGFRHCLACHLLRAGCDIRYIQRILGHKSLSTTQIYTKVDKKDLRFILDKYHPRQFNRRDLKR
jgi:integrase/recombinase XerD